MKKNYFFTILLAFFITLTQYSQDLIITGVFDGSLSGGTPKGAELYAINAIPDLSIYGIGSANNGGGTDGVEFTFPADQISAGTFIYVTANTDEFMAFFGFAANYDVGSAISINGDDAVELFMNEVSVDVFGDINLDGSRTGWDYQDGWAYKKNGTTIGTSFVETNWTYSGVNGLEGGTNNATASIPFPLATYSSATASVKENNIEGFSTFPNPVTNGELTVTSKSSSAKAVSIYNVLGKQVFSDAFSGTFKMLNLAGFSSGIYILRVAESGKIATKKLVIK